MDTASAAFDFARAGQGVPPPDETLPEGAGALHQDAPARAPAAEPPAWDVHPFCSGAPLAGAR